MRVLKSFLASGVVLALTAGSSLAYDVTIDDFNDFVNTGQLTSFFGVPESASDTDLPGVLGGSRDLLVQADATAVLIAGVIPSGILDYMSIGTGLARVTYTGGVSGIGLALACAEAVEVVYLNADDPAQGIDPQTGPALITLELIGGVSASVSETVDSPAGVLSFPLAAFAGVDLQNLTSISLTIDGTNSNAADLAIDSITAVGCETPPSPAPTMGAGGMGLSVLLLVGLARIAVARRRPSLPQS